jgi:putative endonuclease
LPTARSRLGRSAEIAAAAALGKLGYHIVASNFRCRHGEIDLIAKEGGYLVFIEVRCKRNDSYGTPAESITPAKQRKISITAQHYLHAHNIKDIDCRFDVAAVTLVDGKLSVDIIKNAFEV